MSSPSDGFTKDALSPREEAILDLAIEGMTDAQIAHRLAISQSTVNSYWVRIRAKMGPLSRTELVAVTLKHKAREELAELQARNAEFEREAAARRQDETNVQGMRMLRTALAAVPEALFACNERAEIFFANVRLERMFGYGAEDLAGREVRLLLPACSFEVESLGEGSRSMAPRRVGIDYPVYARRSDGSEFRVLILVDGLPSSDGWITSCIVRDFVSEIDTRRRFASAGSKVADLR